MENKELPMPTHEEVLICSDSTTSEDVTLLWKRAMNDPNNLRIFCLVNAELLSYQVCDRGLRTLMEHSQGINSMCHINCFIFFLLFCNFLV